MFGWFWNIVTKFIKPVKENDMSKPNITKEEFLAYLEGASASITKSMQAHVTSGRISQKEADEHLKKYLHLVQKMKADVKSGSIEKTYVLGIRGYYKDSMGKVGENDRNLYDDAFVMVGKDFYDTYRGNTDPRNTEAGKACLLPGYYTFIQGYHGYGKKSGHKAFRTDNPRQVLPVLRDKQNGIKEGVTINFHKGGIYSTNSAGCQTVPPDIWDKEFFTEAYSQTDKTNKRFDYLLIENNF
jgi:hypothetical protein